MRETADRGYHCLVVEDAIDMTAAQGGIVGRAAPADAEIGALAVPGE